MLADLRVVPATAASDALFPPPAVWPATARAHIFLFISAGVAVGDAVEGVVGNAYPQYNIWGPAVDDARKLEMTCKAGQIQVKKKPSRALTFREAQ